MKRLSVRELHMIHASVLPVTLELNIDFKANPGLIDHKLFHNQIKYSNSFLN